MLIYLYSKKENHTAADTDVLIKTSIDNIRGYMTDTFPEQIKISRSNKGKPYIEDCSINIGVTHTADIVIIALSKIDFGIDAEAEGRTVKHMDSVINRYFSERERLYVNSVNRIDERTSRFLEIWVKKEAYFKCFGDCKGGLCVIDTFNHEYKRADIEGYIIYIYSKEAGYTFKITDMRN